MNIEAIERKREKEVNFILCKIVYFFSRYNAGGTDSELSWTWASQSTVTYDPVMK